LVIISAQATTAASATVGGIVVATQSNTGMTGVMVFIVPLGMAYSVATFASITSWVELG